MATVKKANVPPTHPTVWVGLALAVVGLLLATYAYTGARVYSIAFAFVALSGALLALAGILVAAWGRSVMASRASRARRATFQADAMSIAKPVSAAQAIAEVSSEQAPTVAASAEKKRFSFAMPKLPRRERAPKEQKSATPAGEEKSAIPSGAFRFRRREETPEPEAEPRPQPEPLVTLAPRPEPVRVTLRCPQCSTTFSAEGARPFEAVCGNCGFAATV